MIASIADEVMKGAVYNDVNGNTPNFPLPNQTAAMNIKSPYIQGRQNVQHSTSPAYLPVSKDGDLPMHGFEKTRTNDNL